MKRPSNPGTWSLVVALAVFLIGYALGVNGLITGGIIIAVIVGAAALTNGAYVLRRFAALVPTVFLVTLFAFFLQTQRVAPEDVAARVLGSGATQEAVTAFIESNGLDKPFFTRYLDWVSGAVVGDLGTSFVNNTPVADQVAKALPISLQLMLYAQVLAMIIAVPLGVFAARKANQTADKVVSTGALAALSIPNFILALLLIFIFAQTLDILPATRYVYFGDSIVDHFRHMALPTLSLAAALSATYMRLLRADMITTLQESFITTAKAKGVSPRRVLWFHALRPSLFTLLTVFAVNSAVLIGGTLILELIFVIPGMGNLILTAILGYDFMVLQGAVVVLAVGFIILNFLVDLLYAALDPRIRNVRA